MKNPLSTTDYQAVLEFTNRLREELPSGLLCGIILYGSKARKDDQEDSDIDLLVILTNEERENRLKINHIASHVSTWRDVLILPQVVSLARWREMSAAPFSFFANVFADGWPIYGERELFAPLHRDVPPLYDTAEIA